MKCGLPRKSAFKVAAMTATIVHLRATTRIVEPALVQTKPVRKPNRPLTRQQILHRLRAESARRGNSGYRFSEKGFLIELAYAAAHSTQRSILWRGIRFPLRQGIWLAVLDPETGKGLVNTTGGMLI